MEIIRVDEKRLQIREIDSFFAEMLRKIPLETDPGDDGIARERLFGNPIADPLDEFNDEWQAYVEPELMHLFQSATETVSRDLDRIEETDAGGEKTYTLTIPVRHLDPWLNALNQARLVLAARNRFTDEELAADFSPVVSSERDLNLFQIHFYGFLQEIFLREIA